MASDAPSGRSLTATVSLIHGAYFALGGLWPLVSMRTFEMVSGPKRDRWLVRTTALLMGVIGVVLTMAGLKERDIPEIPVLGAGSAASVAGIDLVYGLRGRISRVYLLDGAIELLLMLSWILAWVRRTRSNDSR
jgi:hypothetical protein